MGFLKILFDSESGPEHHARQLEQVQCITTLGDWHQYKLACVVKSGLSLGSAPARSINRSRARNGKLLHIQLKLCDGNMLTGSLGSNGILLSSKALDSSALRNDANVQSVITYFVAHSKNADVEIG